MNLDILWTPWRRKYIEEFSKNERENRKDAVCVLCEIQKKKDEEALIVTRGKTFYIVLNIYPYNTAHVMIVPKRHVKDLEELDEEEAREMFHLLKKIIVAIKKAYSPHAFNIGANIGRDAGAGIEGHFHLHVVPRWRGDTNFMPVISNTKVIPEDLRTTFKKLRQAIRSLEG